MVEFIILGVTKLKTSKMDMPDQKETEEQILDAARVEFQMNGYAGTRMQAIADRAGINKSMLHYYYRSKDKLFQKIFQEAVKEIFPVIFKVLNSELGLVPKVRKLVDTYHELLTENPHLPQFVIHEMNQHPGRFKEFMREKGVGEIPDAFVKQIQAEIEAGTMRPINPREFIINIIGLCIFPFIAQNMIEIIFGMGEDTYKQFIEQRRKELPTFIFNGVNK